MKNQTTHKAVVSYILMAMVAFAVGCGGGGGGGSPTGPGTDISTNSVLAPNTVSTLNTAASLYNYENTAANVAVEIPVNSEAVRFALTITNTGNASQAITVKPESYVTGVAPASVRASVVSAATDDLTAVRVRQGAVEARFRSDFVQSLVRSGGNLRASHSLRAADNSGETPGDLKTFRIIADSSGGSYQDITCKLVRISDHCKIFVDQGEAGGYSAVVVNAKGDYRITESDLDHFVTEFETHIYPLLTQNYGNFYDIDNDGRLTMVFSPVYAQFGFAGLFNSLDLTPGSSANSNQRDIIALWSPNGTWTGTKWLEATRETIAHEMQHIVNMSAKVYPNNILRTPAPSSYENWLETPWLDESLSVAVEVRYRLKRGDPARENRFDRWAASPSSVAMNTFSYDMFTAFWHYGQKGLFNYYLFEQYGDDKIKQLVQNIKTGQANLEEVYGIDMNTLVCNWSIAVLNESLRYQGLIDVTSIDPLYKYKANMQLTISSKNMEYGQGANSLLVSPNATAYYVITQPANFSSDQYRFRIESTEGQNIRINMMRLPNP